MNLESIKTGIKEAGVAVLNTAPSAGLTEKEGRLNYVTAADLASERILKETIQKNFPNHLILSEETESDIKDPLTVEHLWVIDPIDGTSNFRYGREYAGISVGYVEMGEPTAGFIYDPFRDQLFHAVKGEGAYLDEAKIHVSDTADLGKATLLTDNSYEPNGTKRNLQLVANLPQNPWVLMRGSAVLAYGDVAAGRADIYVHQFFKPWDNAAGFVIAKEAGAVIKRFNGEDGTFLDSSLVIGNQALVNQFLEVQGV